jgi:hypothetical protein
LLLDNIAQKLYNLFMHNAEFLNYYPSWMKYDAATPSVKALPDWYKSLGKHQAPGLKSCNPFFDALTAGYMMLTPSDIVFYRNGNRTSVKIADPPFKDFVGERGPEQILPFPEVHGHSMHHFDWWPQIGQKLPEGFSGLYVHPLNRYDLPFLTTNGIVDNDKFHVPGRFPFFIRNGFEGTIPKGTPFIQFIPFERGDWSMQVTQLTEEEGTALQSAAYKEYREVGHSGYRRNKWSPKHFN